MQITSIYNDKNGESYFENIGMSLQNDGEIFLIK